MSYDLWLARHRFARRPGFGSNTGPRALRAGIALALALALVLALVEGLRDGEPVSPRGAQASGVVLAKIDPGIERSPATAASVIVQAFPGDTAKASSVVRAHHGAVGAALPVIGGFQATIGGGMLAAVAASPAVRAITANRQVQ